MNMYSNLKSCVFVSGNLSEYFACHKGVRQGENLSPLLFTLYLNDLEHYMKDNGCSPLEIKLSSVSDQLTNYVKLFILLYADDTIVLSDSKTGLQKALDYLLLYCTKWKLTVNAAKTKVMVFNSTRLNKQDTFHFGDEKLDVVTSFKYLGVEFNRMGSFAKSRKTILIRRQ